MSQQRERQRSSYSSSPTKSNELRTSFDRNIRLHLKNNSLPLDFFGSSNLSSHQVTRTPQPLPIRPYGRLSVCRKQSFESPPLSRRRFSSVAEGVDGNGSTERYIREKRDGENGCLRKQGEVKGRYRVQDDGQQQVMMNDQMDLLKRRFRMVEKRCVGVGDKHSVTKKIMLAMGNQQKEESRNKKSISSPKKVDGNALINSSNVDGQIGRENKAKNNYVGDRIISKSTLMMDNKKISKKNNTKAQEHGQQQLQHEKQQKQRDSNKLIEYQMKLKNLINIDLDLTNKQQKGQQRQMQNPENRDGNIKVDGEDSCLMMDEQRKGSKLKNDVDLDETFDTPKMKVKIKTRPKSQLDHYRSSSNKSKVKLSKEKKLLNFIDPRRAKKIQVTKEQVMRGLISHVKTGLNYSGINKKKRDSEEGGTCRQSVNKEGGQLCQNLQKSSFRRQQKQISSVRGAMKVRLADSADKCKNRYGENESSFVNINLDKDGFLTFGGDKPKGKNVYSEGNRNRCSLRESLPRLKN